MRRHPPAAPGKHLVIWLPHPITTTPIWGKQVGYPKTHKLLQNQWSMSWPLNSVGGSSVTSCRVFAIVPIKTRWSLKSKNGIMLIEPWLVHSVNFLTATHLAHFVRFLCSNFLFPQLSPETSATPTCIETGIPSSKYTPFLLHWDQNLNDMFCTSTVPESGGKES